MGSMNLALLYLLLLLCITYLANLMYSWLKLLAYLSPSPFPSSLSSSHLSSTSLLPSSSRFVDSLILSFSLQLSRAGLKTI